MYKDMYTSVLSLSLSLSLVVIWCQQQKSIIDYTAIHNNVYSRNLRSGIDNYVMHVRFVGWLSLVVV